MDGNYNTKMNGHIAIRQKYSSNFAISEIIFTYKKSKKKK